MKLTSYGGNLDYVIYYSGKLDADVSEGNADVIVIGDTLRLLYFADDHPGADTNTRRRVLIKEVS